MDARAAALAALLVLAGCNGLAGVTGPSADTGTVTPVSVPTAHSPTPTPPPRVSPGIAPDEVVGPFRVADAHANALGDRSFRVVDVTVVRTANGSLRYRRTAETRVAGERFYRAEELAGPAASAVRSPPGTFELYSDGDSFYAAFSHDGNTSYSRAAGGDYVRQRELYSRPPDRGRLFALFDLPERWTVRENGSRVAVVGRATTVNETRFGVGEDVRNVTVRAVVEEGVVRNWTLTFGATWRGERIRVRQSVRYLAVGNTTVNRPPWYDRAAG